ncbi:hypothetical protein HZB00_02425 [Candidatus Woesearchaeota archaeon]|nr:hypothetical protein [Candidatus Woesearchaeota archaeon]
MPSKQPLNLPISEILFFFFIFTSLAFFITIYILQPSLSGRYTASATEQTIGIGFSVTNISRAIINISSPRNNKIYFSNLSLRLNITATNYQSLWYRLDTGQNITLSSNLSLFNATDGNHTLYVFANNSVGLESNKNVSFTINTTQFNIRFERFKHYNGTTLQDYTYDQLNNISNFSLVIGDLGKIVFLSSFNLTGDFDSNNLLDLDRYINISSNLISINTSALSHINVPSVLTLHNLSFTTPRILKDGSVCSSSICSDQSYSGGTLTFQVTGFSTYTSEETPTSSTSGSSSGSGGGGGGGGSTSGTNTSKTTQPSQDLFKISPNYAKLIIKQGETGKSSLLLSNPGKEPLDFLLEVQGSLQDFATFPSGISEYSISVLPGREVGIPLSVSIPSGYAVGLYVSRVVLRANGATKEIPLAVEVKPKVSLFDVQATILPEYKFVKRGDPFHVQINLFNLKGAGRFDVDIEYRLVNSSNFTVVLSKEAIAIETQTSFVRRFFVPPTIDPGMYFFYASLHYAGNQQISFDIFQVTDTDTYSSDVLLNVLFFFAFILLLFFFYHIDHLILHSFHPHKNLAVKPSGYTKSPKSPLRVPSSDHTLAEQLRLLEESYHSGLISKRSYLADKQSIEQSLKRKNNP